MNSKFLVSLCTHAIAVGVGFAAGIYALPILIAPEPPPNEMIAEIATKARYSAQFTRDLADSDALHWGEGEVSITSDRVALRGSLAPGPDYQLYLSPTFVETEADFQQLKADMRHVGPVKTFDNFVVTIPADINVGDYTSVIVWCETFGQFITAAQYR